MLFQEAEDNSVILKVRIAFKSGHNLFLLSTGLTVFETGQKKIEKRKKFKENDASNIDGFLGPWAKYVDEKEVAKPSEVSTLHFFIFKYKEWDEQVPHSVYDTCLYMQFYSCSYVLNGRGAIIVDSTLVLCNCFEL